MVKKTTFNNLRLGAFVMAGLLFLVLLLYMLGKKGNLFGADFPLRTRLRDAKGLQAGHNVRFSGIQVGTVKSVVILNDTTIEVVFMVEEAQKEFIHKNAIVAIGTEGLVGNHVLNISPGKGPGLPVDKNDILAAKEPVDTDAMLETLSKTNKNILDISEGLKSTVERINNSKELWDLLGNSGIAANLKSSLNSIRNASGEAELTVGDVHAIIDDVKNGKGSAGMLLKDSTFADNLNQAVEKIKRAGDNANQLILELNKTADDLHRQLNSGKGSFGTVMQDTAVANKLSLSISHIEQGTKGFNENMEALKHNFLFRGYFRRQEKQKAKAVQQKQGQ
jgi:phospholipid/cholesterol/gamma-HCH transport system substrate-binding protein